MATIEKSFKEYREATEIYPYVKFRYLVKPSKKLPDADFPFFFVKA